MPQRRYPIGAELLPAGGVHFRVWAPRRRKLEVLIDSAASELQSEPGGYFSGIVADAGHGTRYRYRLDGADSFPDPASRFQPEGPHGPSQVVDPSRFAWTDAAWRGLTLEGQVIYELHIGTFTREGTWESGCRHLPELAGLGITVIEVMPVADFPGAFGWGYDGVGLFAPVALYGEPDDFRRFIDDAHRAGLGVILDVVYNHIGPDGNYLKQYSEAYFTARYDCEWGEAINYDGENSAPVRELVTTNAAYWADEYHLDGLRLDATQQIFDGSPENIMAALAKSMRSAARLAEPQPPGSATARQVASPAAETVTEPRPPGSGPRPVIIVAENEAQHARLALSIDRGGYGLDALWNDDFHHSARVAVTGRCEAYYSDYRGTPQELISAAKRGYLFQGQRYGWQAKRRGTPAWALRPAQFVTFIDNHDQIANSGTGERIHQITSPARFRAITAYLLLTPGTPMLFQGQEFAASSPFLFFAAHGQHLRELVKEGRIQFLSQFPSLAQPEIRSYLTDPGDATTFERCKLDHSERRRQPHAGIYTMHQDLLRLRREDGVIPAQRPGGIDGAVLANEAFVLRYFGDNGNDRLLLVNLGTELLLEPSPEPLLAEPDGGVWELLWSSEDPAYGGSGTPPVDSPEGWRIPGHAAVVMRPPQNK